jgi:tetratricopeptide (TPR) repeat protein
VSSRFLARAYIGIGDYGQADVHLRHSIELCRRLGNRLGEAKAYLALGSSERRQGRCAEAIGHCEQALDLFRARRRPGR